MMQYTKVVATKIGQGVKKHLGRMKELKRRIKIEIRKLLVKMKSD